jgi:hypothetical protein
MYVTLASTRGRTRVLRVVPIYGRNRNRDTSRERSALPVSRARFDTSVNYYQVLDVPFGATREEITRAYRRLMRLTHPDQFLDPLQRDKAEERAKLVNAAYAVLSKPEVRQEYDALMRQTAMADAVMARYTGNAPGRPSPLHRTQPPPRPPSARVVRAQRRAYQSAVRQLVLTTAVIAVGLMLVVVFGALLVQGVRAVV